MRVNLIWVVKENSWNSASLVRRGRTAILGRRLDRDLIWFAPVVREVVPGDHSILTGAHHALTVANIRTVLVRDILIT